MALSIKTDFSRAGGGYALLDGPDLAGVTAISVENASGQFLGEDGRWKKAPFAFPVEATPSGPLSLGPHIVDFVPTELLVALRAQDGRDLGRLFWTDVMPSRNPGSVTSSQVFEERRLRAEAEARQKTEARRAEEAATQKAKEAERAQAERAQAERAQAERAQAERLEAERLEAERAQAERDRLERERAEAEARSAREKADAEEAARAEAARREEAARKKREEKRKHRPSWVLPIAAAVLVLLAGAVAAFAFIPGLHDLFGSPEKKEARKVDPPQTRPTRPSIPDPGRPTPVPVDCARAFGTRLDGLQRLADTEKVALGEEALRDGCGLAAFRAFDASAWESNEEAAWNVARFYDPNETRPVYRNVVQAHPDWAAVYYHHWRGRSTRQADALRTICDHANSGGASLRRSCAP